METYIEQAQFVWVLCTPLYLRRYQGQDPEGGRRVNYEGVVISRVRYDHYYPNTKFISVISEMGNSDDVPLPLKGYKTYRLPKVEIELYRLLTDQHITPALPIGCMVYLPRGSPGRIALNVDFVQGEVQAASYTILPVAAIKFFDGAVVGSISRITTKQL